ncbi:hypothetical protein I4U23_008703 [Adineta vaga]|nr:hypothetical protein I4U23_008703 [Adineta vaga]
MHMKLHVYQLNILKCQFITDIKHTSLHEYGDELCYEFQNCIEYFKHIPEYFNIHIDDKIRLLQNHFGIILNINGPIMQSMSLGNIATTWTNVFTLDLAQRLLKSNQLLQTYLRDPILLKIVLIILVLSSGNGRNLDYIDIDQICDNPLSIFAAQNVYVELLWRYILSRSTSEKHAVNYLNKLIMCILYIKNLDMDIDCYVSNLRNEIQQMNPLMQNMWPTSSQSEAVTDIDHAENVI